MKPRISEIGPISVRAVDAARMVGLRSAADLRKTFGATVKPVSGLGSDLYLLADIKRAIASLET
jgi:hypothetical protein